MQQLGETCESVWLHDSGAAKSLNLSQATKLLAGCMRSFDQFLAVLNEIPWRRVPCDRYCYAKSPRLALMSIVGTLFFLAAGRT
jgi:hypothetical protein